MIFGPTVRAFVQKENDLTSRMGYRRGTRRPLGK